MVCFATHVWKHYTVLNLCAHCGYFRQNASASWSSMSAQINSNSKSTPLRNGWILCQSLKLALNSYLRSSSYCMVCVMRFKIWAFCCWGIFQNVLCLDNFGCGISWQLYKVWDPDYLPQPRPICEFVSSVGDPVSWLQIRHQWGSLNPAILYKRQDLYA